MTQRYAQRIADLTPSAIRTMTRECDKVGGINLGQGLGDLPPPAAVRDAAIAALHAGSNTYTAPEGIQALRQAIADKLRRDNQIIADPESEITVTSGSTGAFASVLQALLNPGDGILLFEPFYACHLNTAQLLGHPVDFVPLQLPDFALDEQALRAAIQPHTRALVLCTPSNPSGKIFSEPEILIIDKIAEEYDLLVITDEIYEYLVYDRRRHISPATIGNLRQRTVSIFGFSKTFSVTGWRLGYTVAAAELSRAINLVNDLLYVCAPSPLQYGVSAGLQVPSEYFADLRATYQRKRDLICQGLTSAGLTPMIPQGAYYVLADASTLEAADAKEAALKLLAITGVAAIPGSAFYQHALGERLLRFCFAKDDATLEQAMDRLHRMR